MSENDEKTLVCVKSRKEFWIRFKVLNNNVTDIYFVSLRSNWTRLEICHFPLDVCSTCGVDMDIDK